MGSLCTLQDLCATASDSTHILEHLQQLLRSNYQPALPGQIVVAEACTQSMQAQPQQAFLCLIDPWCRTGCSTWMLLQRQMCSLHVMLSQEERPGDITSLQL